MSDTTGAFVLTDPGMLSEAIEAARRADPATHALYCYDLDALSARAARIRRAFGSLDPLLAYAVKANGLPAILECLAAAGLGADAGSLGELELGAAAGIPPARQILNGNGRTVEEADWAATRGLHSVNADHVLELDLLDDAARRAGRTQRVALRVNPGIPTPGHRYVATGHDEAKFGVSPEEALAAWTARDRWRHIRLDGLHLHVGSQLFETGPMERAVEVALGLAAESERRGAPLGFVNLGGGFGIDYEGAREFPIERHGAWVAERVRGLGLEWVFEPGRWLVGPVGVLLVEVLWVKPRGGRRYVVVGAGMNDLIRPALYGARHRIVALKPRDGAHSPATVAGPVCESADVFAEDASLPPLERGDWLAILDAGAYGAAMASNYNGRGRLAEIVFAGGRLRRARAAESAADIVRRRDDASLE